MTGSTLREVVSPALGEKGNGHVLGNEQPDSRKAATSPTEDVLWQRARAAQNDKHWGERHLHVRRNCFQVVFSPILCMFPVSHASQKFQEIKREEKAEGKNTCPCVQVPSLSALRGKGSGDRVSGQGGLAGSPNSARSQAPGCRSEGPGSSKEQHRRGVRACSHDTRPTSDRPGKPQMSTLKGLFLR